MTERNSITRNRKPATYYTLNRVIGEDGERFEFASDEYGFRKLWKPRYEGHLKLWPFAADIELMDLRHDILHVVNLSLESEVAMYAQSRKIRQRSWAGHRVAQIAISKFIDGNLESDPFAQEYLDGLTHEQVSVFQSLAANAAEIS